MKIKRLDEKFGYNIPEDLEIKLKIENLKPVMYSIYGDICGPWHFGYEVEYEHNHTCVVDPVYVFKKDYDSAWSYRTYPKLIVPFEDFDPINMKNNK